MVQGSRIRQIGWAVALTICFGIFAALTFQVNSVKSEVRLAERHIVALEREKLLLETEFQARANQQQLADWNAIEFGYKAPRADQYIAGERQLASLGVPTGVGAPSPIRVARAPDSEELGMPEMVSPVSGRQLLGAEPDQPVSQEREANSVASEFARAFGETTPLVARVAEVVE
ncbi:hypothetical protein [Altererythrobacter sp. MF3-039]|uniref:hypothetical protein n=1 Tax=Altererythrobacter sp. MF3-039 TaxID=3252901 RepID=UPI00390C4585